MDLFLLYQMVFDVDSGTIHYIRDKSCETHVYNREIRSLHSLNDELARTNRVPECRPRVADFFAPFTASRVRAEMADGGGDDRMIDVIITQVALRAESNIATQSNDLHRATLYLASSFFRLFYTWRISSRTSCGAAQTIWSAVLPWSSMVGSFSSTSTA